MCHLVIAMPILAIPIFWLMPPVFSVPIYVVIVIVSGLLYWQITRSMKKPVTTGAESLLNTKAEVVSKSSQPGNTKYLVRTEGEIWSASSSVSLQPGETVCVVAVEGLKLVVEPFGGETGEKKKPE